MAHEITSSDRLILNSGLPAWHGLGIVVNRSLTPTEAVREVIPWEPDPDQLYVASRTNPGTYDVVPDFRANRRNDNGEVLGVVSEAYKVITNRELAQFGEAMVGADRVAQVETAGSLRGGRRVFILMRLPFDVRVGRTGSDRTQQYVLLSNAHDGTAAAYATWTGIRVVCANTMGMAVGANFEAVEAAAKAGRAVRITHTGDIASKLPEARRILGLATTQAERFARLAERMAAVQLGTAGLAEYFDAVYVDMFGPNPRAKAKVATSAEAAAEAGEEADTWEARRVKLLGEWTGLLDHEWNRVDGIAGTLWAALQAVTQWHDHQRSAGTVTGERRTHSTVFGVAAADKRLALRRAATLVA